MATWLDPADIAVRSAIVSGGWGRTPHTEHGNPIPGPDEIDAIADALAVASDLLTRLTAFAVHPAMQVVEDFTARPTVTRLYPSFSPVRSVLAVEVDGGADATPPISGWSSFAGAIHFSPDAGLTLRGWMQSWCDYSPSGVEHLRVLYNAGSTITAAARRAVIALAHEYWLETSGCEECGTCQLPNRTTAVQREGLSYQVGDPYEGGQVTLTGVPVVDQWIRSVNPANATRPSGVWTPDSPPPVVRSVHTAIPLFGSGINVSSGASLNASAVTT